MDWVAAVEVALQAVTGCFFLHLKCAEHPVPDYQNPAIVFVEILVVRAVVNPVMGRRVQYHFERAKFANRLGMYPGLISQYGK